MGLFKIGAVVAALGVVLFYNRNFLQVTNYWYRTNKLDRKDFEAGDFTVHTDIPTTYYTPGKLGDVLKEWDHRFHLYRVQPGQEFKFDPSVLHSDILARKLDYTCFERQETDCNKKSVLTPNCVFDLNNTNGREEVIPASKILTEEGNGWHASFATMQNKNVIKELWDSLKIPISISKTNFEHAFISNLLEDGITAGFHANPATDSMAATFVGHKTWMFLPSYVYRDMMESKFGASSIFMTRSPPKDKPAEVFIYTSQPGDVLFFPEAWGHAVYTYKGPNFMINYRSMWMGNVMHQPLTWLSAIFFNTLFKTTTTNKNPMATDIIHKKAFAAVPFKDLNVKIIKMYTEMCETGGKVGFDAQMIGFMEEAVAKFKSENPHLL